MCAPKNSAPRGGVSPSIAFNCDPSNLRDWFRREAQQIEDQVVRELVGMVVLNLDSFVRWPKRAELLWDGCTRPTRRGKGSDKHTYPVELIVACKVAGVTRDSRSNGPAVTAFELAGGQRPPRARKRYAWSVHHVYSKQFPYPDKGSTLHAVAEARHFTQSAGLVAVHPIADAAADEFACLAWFLRAEAFLRFGYDPDRVFSDAPHNDYGFVGGRSVVIRCPGSATASGQGL